MDHSGATELVVAKTKNTTKAGFISHMISTQERHRLRLTGMVIILVLASITTNACLGRVVA